MTRAHQNSDVNNIKKQNQTKKRINKEKGTYRLLKEGNFFKGFGNFEQFCTQKPAKTSIKMQIFACGVPRDHV